MFVYDFMSGQHCSSDIASRSYIPRFHVSSPIISPNNDSPVHVHVGVGGSTHTISRPLPSRGSPCIHMTLNGSGGVPIIRIIGFMYASDTVVEISHNIHALLDFSLISSWISKTFRTWLLQTRLYLCFCRMKAIV